MTQPNEVDGSVRDSPVHHTCKCRRCEDVVFGCRPGRKLHSGCTDSTTCRATFGPDGATSAPLLNAGNCEDAYSGAWITEPTCTP